MIFSSICAPAIIYIAFSMIKIIIDIYKGIYDNAVKGIIIMVIISLVINILCELGLSVIAWIFVFVPIIMMTIISTLLLKVFDFNLDKDNIKSKIVNNDSKINTVSNDISNNNDDYLNRLDRLDRDDIRENLYDNLDDIYNFSHISSSYNIPENIVEYSIANNYINRR